MKKRLNRMFLTGVLAFSLVLVVILSLSGTARARENDKGFALAAKEAVSQANGGAFLTGPQQGSALDIALGYVQRNQADLGLTDADVAELIVSYEYVTHHNGVTHIYLQQQRQGIDVFNGVINVNVAADGSIINLHNGFVANLGAEALNAAAPTLTAVEAVAAAAQNLGLQLSQDLVVEEAIGGAAQAVKLSTGGISLEAIPARLVYQPMESGAAHLAWDLSIYQLDASAYWHMRVDAATGEILAQQNLVVHEDFLEQAAAAGHDVTHVGHSDALAAPLFDVNSALPDSYKVYTIPVETPNHVPPPLPTPPADGRATAVDPATSASPFGWHDTDGVPGHESQFTVGNNTDTYEDTNNSNSPTGGDAARADGGATLDFDHPIDLTLAPINYVDAAVTNLFYWTNVIHDVLYEYGFDEPSGNFQENNYGNGGAGSDSVNAEAQDGGGNCNANFATPSDGLNPRMQMYTCTNSNPARDGDLDNMVIVHEYGHGISNRLTGGPANVSCLNNSEQMGEGWSDWYGLMLTQQANQTDVQARGVGTWLFGQDANGPGIRPTPYSTDMNINPTTYGDIGGLAIPHGVGYAWATMLWEVNWGLIGAHGFNQNFYDDWTTGGNNLALQLVTDGMKLQPCSPGFVDGRDAILLADSVLTGGANECIIWEAFAKRGLGFSASQGSSGSTTDGTEAFDMPPACLMTLKIDKTADPAVVSPGDVLSYTLVVANDTVSTLTGVVISDVVPMGVDYIPGSASDGGSEAGGVVTWPAITMLSGDQVTRTFQVTVTTSTSPIANTACVQAAEGDNDCDSINTLVFAPAPFPTCLDFESGTLPASMFAETDSNGGANGRVAVTTAFPNTGSWALDIDTDCAGCGGSTTQAAVMVIDLGGVPDAELNLWVHEHGDENNPEDGIFISDDGGNTYAQILSLNNFPASYQQVNIDLVAAASGAGMSLVDGFLIKFQSLDNFSIPTDGYSFDDICVQGAAPQIQVSPNPLNSSQTADQTVTQTLLIENTGTFTLTWDIDEDAGSNCAAPTDIPWLSLPISTGQTPSSGSDALDVVFDSTGLTSGLYTGTLCVNSDDPINPLIEVDVNMTVLGAASFPVCADFETGSLPFYMFPETVDAPPANGRVAVTTAFPNTGSFALDIDTDCNGCGGSTLQSGTMIVDLAGQSGVELNLWVHEHGDEDNPEDGIFISDDGGVTWAQALSLNGFPASYVNVLVDLDAAVATAGMSFVDGFLIRFQSFDNFSIATDGYSFDDICVQNAQPDIVVDPTSLNSTQYVNEVVTMSVDIDNIGSTDLNWTITEAPSNCAAPADVPWADASPTSGTTAAAGTDSVDVVFDATGLTPDTTYNGLLCVNSDDPDTPVVTVTLDMFVEGLPTIEVTPSELTSSQSTDTQVMQTLTISNVGTADLDWMIEESQAIVLPQVAGDGNYVSGLYGPSAGAAPANGQAAAGADSGTPIDFALGSNVYSWNSQNGPYYTIFDLDVPEVLPNIAAFPAGGNFVGGGEYVNGLVYMADTANNLYEVDPATGAILNTMSLSPAPPGGETISGMAIDPTTGIVYGSSTNVSSSSLMTIDVTTGATALIGTITNSPGNIGIAIDGAGDLWGYDIVNDSFMGIDKNTGAGTIIGSLGFDANFGQGMGYDAATDQVFLVAFNNGAFQPELRIADRSTGNTTFVGVLGATTPGGLNQLSWAGTEISLVPPCDVSDIPWATVSPISGTTGAGNATDVTVTFDSTGLAADVYTGTLCVNSNDPFNPLVTVPLTMTVVPNEAPVAADDAYTTTQGVTLTVAVPGVLANDTDGDGDPLTAVLDTDVASGTLTLNADGSFTYIPDAGFDGSDSFTYHANDGTDDSNVATVTITVLNTAPVAVDDAYTIDQDTVLTVTVSGVLTNDMDADGDALTAVLDTDVTSGTLTLNADGSFVYIPDAGFTGTDSFTYHANDGTDDSNVATVTITVSEVGYIIYLPFVSNN